MPMLLMSPGEPTSNRKLAWLGVALLAYFAVLMLPTPAGLTESGQVALGLLVLVIILWISECVSPAASAVVLTGMAVLGLMGKPLTAGGRPLSSAGALDVMLAGFPPPRCCWWRARCSWPLPLSPPGSTRGCRCW